MSRAMEIPFYDADDFHPASNVEKMARGHPLDDEDRRPWLETLAGKLPIWQEEGGAVLACSALKESYRELLGSHCGDDIKWAVLDADRNVLADRLKLRKDHFFDAALLDSQIDALEVPDYGWLIDINASPQDIVTNILTRLGSE